MKCLFVYNPNSGKSGLQKRIDYIISQLKTIYDDVDYIPTSYAGHAKIIAKESCGKYDYLVVSGGDGTMNEIVNGLAEQDNAPIVGYLPSGTVNDISKSLKIPKNLKKALMILRQNCLFRHDIFKINDNHYGIYFCGTGAFTATSYETKQYSKKLLGKLAYLNYGAKLLGHIPQFHAKITTDDHKIVQGDYIMMIIMNSRSTAGFLANKKADLSDGLVDIILIKRKNNNFINYCRSLSSIARFFIFGIDSMKNGTRVTRLKLSHFNLELSENNVINIDGEKGPTGNIYFNVIKQGLKIIVNPKLVKTIHKYEIKREKKEKKQID